MTRRVATLDQHLVASRANLLANANAGTTECMSRGKRGSDETEAETKPAPAKIDSKPPEMPADAKPDAKPHTAAKADDVTAKVEATDEPTRTRVNTLSMPVLGGFGAPPDVPTMVTPPLMGGAVEEPTHMPGPRNIPSGNPDDLAPPPGLVPPGDSRSLRKRGEFALIYRQANAVITRWGSIGTRGQWRVVEYPTTAAASHSYAKESSRFVSEGFSDYRD